MKTVMIMEDQVALATHWREHLEDAGYNVVHAKDYQEAVALLEKIDVEVVVSDMLIYGDDGKPSSSGGLSLLSHMRLHVKPIPKTIAVSGAHPQLNILRHAELLKADEVIVKPFSVEELISKINDLLRK